MLFPSRVHLPYWGWAAAMIDHGFSDYKKYFLRLKLTEDQVVTEYDRSRCEEYEIMCRFFKSSSASKHCIFTMDDFTATSVYKASQDAGLKVGEQVFVVGYGIWLRNRSYWTWSRNRLGEILSFGRLTWYAKLHSRESKCLGTKMRHIGTFPDRMQERFGSRLTILMRPMAACVFCRDGTQKVRSHGRALATRCSGWKLLLTHCLWMLRK